MNYSADMLNSTRKTDHVIVYQIKIPTQGGNDEKPEKQCRQKKKNIHTDRIAGRYSDHSDSGGDAAACPEESQGQSACGHMHGQSENLVIGHFPV